MTGFAAAACAGFDWGRAGADLGGGVVFAFAMAIASAFLRCSAGRIWLSCSSVA
jgi:hypothetical protein